jgi:hypothetical protein
MLEVTAGGKAALNRVARCAELRLAEMLEPLGGPAGRRIETGLGLLREAFAAPPLAAAERKRRPGRTRV